MYVKINSGDGSNICNFNASSIVFNEGSSDIDFRVESNNFSHMLFVDGGNDKVMIGLETPDVFNGTTPPLQIEGTDNNKASLSITRNSNDNGQPLLILSKSRGTSVNSDTILQDNDVAGEIVFLGADGNDRNSQVASITAVVDGTPGADDMPGRITFRTTEDGSSSTTERMRINNVGGLKAFADGTTTQSALTDQVHEFAHASSDKDMARFGVSNTSYGNNGVNVGCTRSSSTSYNTLATHHGNDGSDRYADRTFIVRGDGQIFSDAGTTITSGADYAEYFEWKDGNSSNQDRIGHSVVLDGHKIRKATSDDSASNILGVISGNPSVVGDTAELRWQGKWELDDFNRRQTEEVEVWEWKADDGVLHSYRKDKVPEGLTVPSDKTVKKVINDKYSSSYDESKKDGYVPRSQRKEWDAVGLMGKLRMLKGQPTGDRWIKMRDISDTVEEWLVR